MAAQGGDVAIGFEGVAADEGPDQTSYTVKFSASTPEPEENKSEEIVLLETRGSSPEQDEEHEESVKKVIILYLFCMKYMNIQFVYF